MKSSARLVPLFPDTEADVTRLAYVGRKPGKPTRDADAWFTPPLYLDSVRMVLKGIDLDPFSSAAANKIVKAAHFFSTEKSAFEHSWHVAAKTRVFMNPPYSSRLIGRAVARFIDEWRKQSFNEGIVLVNNATDTRWFRLLAAHCQSMCFTDHRISFWNADGKRVSGNTRGQAFLYFGKHKQRFTEVFSKHGFVLEPSK